MSGNQRASADTGENIGIAFGPFRLVPGSRRLTGVDGKVIGLSGKGFELLWYLARNPGRLIGKDELMETVWPGTVVEENSLSQAISALRHALGDDAKNPQYIATIKGRGYQFIGDARRLDEPAGAAEVPRPRYTAAAGLAVAIAALLVVLAVVAWPGRDADQAQLQAGIIERFDDAKVKLVTNYAGSHSEPALSPSGQLMAYASDASGTSQIWIKPLNRGEPARVTSGPYPATSPAWYNNDQLLYTRFGPDGPSLYSVDILGDSEPRLVAQSASQAQHALNAGAFVYSQGRRIWLARNDGRDRTEIGGVPVSQGFASREPALSPDGTQVAFIHADEGPLGNLWVIAATGGEARQLTSPETGGGIASSPAWSPDGRFIVYSVNAGAGRSHLWRVDVASGEARPLTVGPGGAGQAALSADGRSVAYTAARPRWLLTRIDLATREAETLYESRTRIILPVSSPDRKSIAFFTQLATGIQLFTLDHDGDNLQQRTFDDPGMNALPTWASDGSALIYYRGRSLYRLNLDDGSDEQLVADFHWSTRNWLDVYQDRMSFHNVDRTTGHHRTVIREFGALEGLELPVPVEAAQWSPDGEELLGFYRPTGNLVICRADATGCRDVEHEGLPLRGHRAMWSPGGRQIYYAQLDRDRNTWTLWRVGRDGSDNELVADLPGFESENSNIDLTGDGGIYYNHPDQGSSEIWLATIDEEN